MRVKSFNLAKYILLLCAFAVVSAHAQRVTDHREMGKTLSMSSSDELRIESKHSDIEIHHWDRNQVKFELRMEVIGKNERDVSRLLEAIHFEMRESDDGISVEAWMGPFSKMNSWDKGSNFVLKNGTKINGIYEYSLEIEVYMPRESKLNVEHAFGNLTLEDMHKGDMELEAKHGNITMGDACCQTEIDLAHGTLDMGDANRLMLDMRHSNANVGSAEELSLEIQHSNLSMGSVDELNTEAGHSTISIGKIRRLEIENNHSTIKIGRLVSSLDSEVNHGQIKINALDSDFDEIDVELNYGQLEINAGSTSYRLDYQGQHASLKVGSDFSYDEKNEDEHGHNKEIRGHKGSGGGLIQIKTQHGSVVVE